jgi:cobalt/nickel transport system ATP-binding protein
MSIAIELADVTVLREGDAGRSRPVVSGLSLSVGAGERLALVGKNGAGKTSLLLSLVGALEFSGEIRIGELVVARRTLRAVRRAVSYVFADPADQLFCASVAEEVGFGARELGLAEGAVRERTQAAVELMGLKGLETRNPAALSLGEQRRVALAAALATRPGAMLIDEPTASLDPVARRELLAALAGLDATIVIASHDLDAVLELGARTLVLSAGRAVADGPAQQILHDEALLERAGLALPLSVLARRA